MEPKSHKRDLPAPVQNKLNSILKDITTKSQKIKLNHVKPKVQTRMPQELENQLCINFSAFPVTYDYICPRFDVNDPAGYKHLEEYGYVVFKNVIKSSKEINGLKNEMWDWLEELSFPVDNKINRNDPTTWHDGNWPTDPDTGIIFSFGVGQTKFMWKVRSYPDVKKAFATIWGTNDLITSFDGCNLYRPWKYHRQWRTKGKWWHLDQNARRKQSIGKQSIQGIVALTDGNDKTGGLCVIPKTHFQHTEICERIHWPSHSDYVPIPKKDRLFDDYRKTGAYLVHYKAGDLVLWDGRTVHCNCPSIEPDLNPKTGKQWISDKDKLKTKWNLTRMICYICMGPRYQAKNEILKKRQEIAFNMHVTSTHFPQYFRYRLGAGVVGHGKWKLNEYQKQLVGYPRNWFQEFMWQLKYEFELGFGDLWVFTSFVAAVGFATNCYYKNKRKQNK